MNRMAVDAGAPVVGIRPRRHERSKFSAGPERRAVGRGKMRRGGVRQSVAVVAQGNGVGGAQNFSVRIRAVVNLVAGQAG